MTVPLSQRFKKRSAFNNKKVLCLLTLFTTAITIFWYNSYHLQLNLLFNAETRYRDKPFPEDSPLPCLADFKQNILNDNFLSNSTRQELLGYISLLTYNNRDRWISRLNPIIIQDWKHLHKVRSVCPVGSIALITITSGISNSIQEWLFYHLLLGIQRIILYDDSVPGSPEQQLLHNAIQIFVERGYVIHKFVTEHVGLKFSDTQTVIYTRALKEYEDEYQWMGFIDHDEFVTLHQDKCLASFLSRYIDFGGVVLQNRLRGCWNVSTHDMTRTHFEQYEYATRSNRLVKSFVQPKHTERILVHHGVYHDGWWAVNFQKNNVTDHFNVEILEPTKEFSMVELRHFYVGDLQHALYEKVCGLNDERNYYRILRIEMIKHALTDGNVVKETDFILPLIHEEFKSLFFSNL